MFVFVFDEVKSRTSEQPNGGVRYVRFVRLVRVVRFVRFVRSCSFCSVRAPRSFVRCSALARSRGLFDAALSPPLPKGDLGGMSI